MRSLRKFCRDHKVINITSQHQNNKIVGKKHESLCKRSTVEFKTINQLDQR